MLFMVYGAGARSEPEPVRQPYAGVDFISPVRIFVNSATEVKAINPSGFIHLPDLLKSLLSCVKNHDQL